MSKAERLLNSLYNTISLKCNSDKVKIVEYIEDNVANPNIQEKLLLKMLEEIDLNKTTTETLEECFDGTIDGNLLQL